MPEGPSILILKEAASSFKGKKIIVASGNAKIDMVRIENEKVIDFKTWGKQFLICFKGFTIRIHLLMFGSYAINERKERAPRLSLQFKNGELNFYTCSVKIIEGKIDDKFDWSCDVMNPLWDEKKAEEKLLNEKDTLICDSLLDQNIFSGVGNIIKNEVLFRVKIHPESITTKIPLKQLKLLIRETVKYSFEFLNWKKKFVLKKHWLAYNKKTCPRDDVAFKKAALGKRKRRSFYCAICQVKYT
jgi:endonuclease-8